MLVVTPTLAIDENELEEKFVAASGPGGQNVNKVATAVQLRFDVAHSRALPEAVRQRLLRLAVNRVSADGILIVDAHRFRTQEQNRQDARRRLAALIYAAVRPPKVRRPTRVTAAAQARRLESKVRRGRVKRLRGARPEVDD
jgi:ribosome-associated protein